MQHRISDKGQSCDCSYQDSVYAKCKIKFQLKVNEANLWKEAECFTCVHKSCLIFHLPGIATVGKDILCAA